MEDCLESKELFLGKTCSDTVIDESKDGYPELEEKKDFIFKVSDRKKKIQ